nr:MerR family DNA-binding transcriptional regulator [Ktedonobacter racemifer]
MKTVQRWDRESRLKAKGTLSGRRSSHEVDLTTALNLPKLPAAR